MLFVAQFDSKPALGGCQGIRRRPARKLAKSVMVE